jgi:hypothetical protein
MVEDIKKEDILIQKSAPTLSRRCMHCDKIIPDKDENGFFISAKRKFCDSKCRTRYFSLIRYNRIKNDPEYKKYRKKYFDEWRKVNRDHFNSLMRNYSKAYQTKIRAQKKIEKSERLNKQTNKTKGVLTNSGS